MYVMRNGSLKRCTDLLPSLVYHWRLQVALVNLCGDTECLLLYESCRIRPTYLWNDQEVFEIIPQRLYRWKISSFFSVHLLCSVKNITMICFCPLRCSVCCDHLTNWYYEKDGKLYCRKHYWEKFGELCHGCSLLMTGPAMVSLLHLLSRDLKTVSTECWMIDYISTSLVF